MDGDEKIGVALMVVMAIVFVLVVGSLVYFAGGINLRNDYRDCMRQFNDRLMCVQFVGLEPIGGLEVKP